MRPDRRLLLAAVALLLGAAAVVVVLLTRGDDPAPRTEPSPPATTATPSSEPAAEAEPFVPTGLEVDAIDVDAPVVGLGTASDGSQAVPEELDVTGWWERGARVGGPGSAAVVGHTASRGGGVFDRLDQLDRGDEISVTGDDDATATYVVREVETVDVDDFRRYAARIYARGGPGRLVLMTCGDWDGQEFGSTVIAWADLQDS